MSPVSSRPFARSLAVAAAAHLCAVLVLGRKAAPRRATTATPAPIEVAIDPGVEPPPPEEPPEPPPRRLETVASIVPRRASPSPLPAARPDAAPAAVAPTLTAPPSPSALPSADAWAPTIFRSGYGAAALGLTPEGRARGLPIPSSSASGPPPPNGDVAGIGKALLDHDRKLGIGPGGPLVAAVEDVTSQSLAPVDGAATFIIDTDAKGEVTSVSPVDATSDEPTWREVAAMLLAKMKGHPLHLRPGWSGLTVTLRVRSRLQTPSGASARGRLPTAARVALAPLKILTGNFDVVDLSNQEFRRIDAWEVDEKAR